MLIVNCPDQVDDDETVEEKKLDQDERSMTMKVKLNRNEFDLREIIKKRRLEDQQHQRTVHLLPDDQQNIVQNQRSSMNKSRQH